MSKSFIQAIEEGLARDAALDEFVMMLRTHRDRGLTAAVASEALEELRSKAKDSVEDRILEILDIVAGFCAPHMRVWEPPDLE